MQAGFYPQNSNPLVPAWRLAQYSFPEVLPGYCIEKASYFSQFTLTPDQSIFNQEMPIDRASDFLWNEWRMALYNIVQGSYPGVKVRVRDSLGRKVAQDFIEVPQSTGMLVVPMTLLAGSSLYIDATADDAQTTTITFMLVFRGWKRFLV
jgi:hypothetical protein